MRCSRSLRLKRFSRCTSDHLFIIYIPKYCLQAAGAVVWGSRWSGDLKFSGSHGMGDRKFGMSSMATYSKRQMQIFFFSRELKTCLISSYIPHSSLWPFRVELQFSNFHHAQEASARLSQPHIAGTPPPHPHRPPLLRSCSPGGVEAEPEAVIVAGVAKRRQAP